MSHWRGRLVILLCSFLAGYWVVPYIAGALT